jgi:hypothetical protein
MRTIRKILLTEYIGAILVAVLVADAFSAPITAVVAQVSLHAALRHNPTLDTRRLSTTYSPLDALSESHFTWFRPTCSHAGYTRRSPQSYPERHKP